MSALQWLDFSPSERDEVLLLLESQKDRSTVDELGLGLVRDAISDHLFPGVSTIQTRARYFLFVPWLLRELEHGSVTDENLARRLRIREVALIKSLLATDEEDGERHSGLIGRESGDATKRLPSTIYWSGVRRWGIYKGTGSLHEYLSDLPDLRKQRSRRTGDTEDGVGNDRETTSTWDPGLPKAEEGFLNKSTFALTRDEALYLKEKILSLRSVSGHLCLLQWMVQHLDVAAVAQLNAPWSLLDSAGSWPTPPVSLRTELTHARHFSLCTRTLTAAYCRILAEHRRDLDPAHFDEMLAASFADLTEHAAALTRWHSDLPSFWRWVAQVNPRLQRDRPFIEEWLRLLADAGFLTIEPARLTSTKVERWMQTRERRLKGTLARMGNPPVLQRWSPPGHIGLTNYRWRIARDVVIDILTGLGRTGVQPDAGS